MSLLDTVLGLPPETLRAVIAGLTDEEKVTLAIQMRDAEANPYFRYRHDAVAFVTEGLREAVWSKQVEVLSAIHKHRKVVVAASHSTGKSHIASRAAGAVALSWPSDMVRVQTTATNFRQVKGILWPYMARMHRQYKLPGEVFTTAWKIGAEEVGMGFTASINNEAAVSGFHATGELFLVVDEGGGIHPVLGQAFNNVLTGTGHALVIGNFPTDSDDTWFNRIWASDEWHHIRISAFDTPAFPRPGGKSLKSMAEVDLVQAELGVSEEERGWELPLPPRRQPGGELHGLYEEVGRCTICPPTIDPHTIGKHTTDQEWVRSIASEFGEDSAYYQSRVLAMPATDLVDKTLPMTWLESAMVPPGTGRLPLPVKLGCDIAADGGDEFVIARMTGWQAEVVFSRAGAENANTMDVAGVILKHIIEAQDFHDTHGITEKVRVKIDSIGIGRGVSDRLISMAEEINPETDRPFHRAEIVPVESSRKAHRPEKFKNQRSEMWWTIREVIQPDPLTGEAGELTIVQEESVTGARLLKQLNAPRWRTTSTGQTMVQLKSEVKAATGQSPDRADAILLAVYEPPEREKTTLSAAPLFGSQTNYWALG